MAQSPEYRGFLRQMEDGMLFVDWSIVDRAQISNGQIYAALEEMAGCVAELNVAMWEIRPIEEHLERFATERWLHAGTGRPTANKTYSAYHGGLL
jgi:hypothetical protein